ncbi:hypothetical protein BS78_04G060900 [Paspalum vaginatum]|nr:hypothetical protein BS78_04G060900 [Paspalum vaginatum]
MRRMIGPTRTKLGHAIANKLLLLVVELGTPSAHGITFACLLPLPGSPLPLPVSSIDLPRYSSTRSISSGAAKRIIGSLMRCFVYTIIRRTVIQSLACYVVLLYSFSGSIKGGREEASSSLLPARGARASTPTPHRMEQHAGLVAGACACMAAGDPRDRPPPALSPS